jgi:RNA polymerase sigma factor (sigma-70 family)
VAEPAGGATGGSVSRLIDGLWRGSDSAFTGIVRRFRPRLIRQARRRMGPQLARAVGPEDLAMAAFLSLWRAVRKERDVPLQLADRNDLLRLLAEFTAQKVRQARRYHTQEKRDVRRTLRHADLPPQPAGEPVSLDMPDRRPPPEWQVLFEDTRSAWLADLRPVQRQIVCLRLEGFQTAEIAHRLGCSLRSVERQLSEVRSRWQERAAAFEGPSGDARHGSWRPPAGDGR